MMNGRMTQINDRDTERVQNGAACLCGSRRLTLSPFPSCRPSNGGQDCAGVNYEYQLCSTSDCPKHFEDFRAQQCQHRNAHFEFQGARHHWLSYEHPDGKEDEDEHTPSCEILIQFDDQKGDFRTRGESGFSAEESKKLVGETF